MSAADLRAIIDMDLDASSAWSELKTPDDVKALARVGGYEAGGIILAKYQGLTGTNTGSNTGCDATCIGVIKYLGHARYSAVEGRGSADKHVDQ